MDFRRLLLGLVPLLLLSSCKPRRPKDVLSEQKMEDVLYDYHYAVSLAGVSHYAPSADVRDYMAEEAVFARHRITREQFRTSLQYYTAHADELYRIYDRLAERYGAAPPASSAAEGDAGPDVTDLWAGRDSWLLTAAGLNRRSFTVEADTAFHPGDELTWSFSTAWLYKEGVKSAVASLSLHYDNDSTYSLQQYIYNSDRQTLTLRTDREARLLRVTGFIYQLSPWDELPRLLVVDRIRLRRRHLPEAAPEPPAAAPADTLAAPTPAAAPPAAAGRLPEPPQPAGRRLQPEQPLKLQDDDTRPLRRLTREQIIRDSLLDLDRRRGIVNRRLR